MIFSYIGRAVILTVLFTFFCLEIVSSKPASPVKISQDLLELAEKRKETLKAGILKNLKYSNPPDVRRFNSSITEKRQKIREFKEYLRQKQDMRFIAENDESNSSEGSKVYKYIVKENVPGKVNPRIWNSGGKRIYFNFNENHPESPHDELVVKSAVFKINKNASWVKTIDGASGKMEISVHKILNVTLNGIVEKKFIESRLIDLKASGSEDIDFTSLVQEWIDNEERNFGIELTSSTHNISNNLNSSKIDVSNSLGTPFSQHSFVLELKASVQPILKRVERQAARRDCTKGDGETRCCRFTTYISFKDIGWDDWILAPPGYEAHYCDGSCPHGFKVANTFASIQSILHLKNKADIPAPCCVPAELSPLTILHLDDHGQYTFTDHPDMIVEDCRCA